MATCNEFVVKVSHEDVVRRFTVQRDQPFLLETMTNKIVTLFPKIKKAYFKKGTALLQWTDEDGDHITVTSDEELEYAVQFFNVTRQIAARFFVVCSQANVPSPQPTAVPLVYAPELDGDEATAPCPTTAPRVAAPVPPLGDALNQVVQQVSRSIITQIGPLLQNLTTNATVLGDHASTAAEAAAVHFAPLVHDLTANLVGAFGGHPGAWAPRNAAGGPAPVPFPVPARAPAGNAAPNFPPPATGRGCRIPVTGGVPVVVTVSAGQPTPPACSASTTTTTTATATATPLFHPHVICDGCEQGITGSRFKCVECPDFDLCGACEATGMHAEHYLLRIRIPNVGLSTSVHWEGGDRRWHGLGRRYGRHCDRFKASVDRSAHGRDAEPQPTHPKDRDRATEASTECPAAEGASPWDSVEEHPYRSGCPYLWSTAEGTGGLRGDEFKAHLATLDTATLNAKESKVKEKLTAVQAKHAALLQLLHERRGGLGGTMETSLNSEASVASAAAVAHPAHDPFMTLDEYLGRKTQHDPAPAAPRPPLQPAGGEEKVDPVVVAVAVPVALPCPAVEPVAEPSRVQQGPPPAVYAPVPRPPAAAALRFPSERAVLLEMGVLVAPENEALFYQCNGDVQTFISALYK